MAYGMGRLRNLARKLSGEQKRAQADEKLSSRIDTFRLNSADRHEVSKDHKGDLAKVFFGPKSRIVDKWLHYLDIYEQHFAKHRGKDIKFLEIGVFKGGSLEMWRSYFGPQSKICGIDIDPACAAYETPGTTVRIGSQADPAFLKSVVAEFGVPDIVLDDGSHVAKHQEVSFHTLFPLLAEGGLYIIEDLHTSYWPKWDGGYRRPGSAIELVKDMVDDLHAWYHDHPTTTPAQHEIHAIHVYDSMVFIEKKRRQRPSYIRIPATGSDIVD